MRDWDSICRIIHQCWISFQLGAGQQYNTEPTAADLDSCRRGVEFMLRNSNAGAGAQHAAWMADRRAAGWVWGPVKDTEKKTHPDLVPYSRLPTAEKLKDENFLMACRLALQLFPEA